MGVARPKAMSEPPCNQGIRSVLLDQQEMLMDLEKETEYLLESMQELLAPSDEEKCKVEEPEDRTICMIASSIKNNSAIVRRVLSLVKELKYRLNL